jgi:hypothetical protein
VAPYRVAGEYDASLALGMRVPNCISISVPAHRDSEHPRLWSPTPSPIPEHVAAAKTLRQQRIAILRPAPEPEVQRRCLADYDTALGLDGAESRR